MKLIKVVGATSEIWQVFVQDSSSTTGAGLTGLTNASGSLTAYYHRDTDTSATAISLVSMTIGTFTSSGFKEIDSANMPGFYQFCPPNAALASGAKSCAFVLKGAANMAPLPIEVQLTAGFSFDAAAPNVTSTSVGTGAIANTSFAAGAIDAAAIAASAIGSSELASGAITAAKFATDAIDANALAADAVTEIGAGVLSAAAAAPIASAVKKINNTTVNGNGAGTPWGP